MSGLAMSGLAWIAVIVALILVACAIWLARLVRFVNRPSEGPTIPPGRERSALLLVDMQSEHFEGENPEDETRLLEAAKDAVSDARAAGNPVIALRHGWQTPGTRLMARMMLGGKGLAWAP